MMLVGWLASGAIAGAGIGAAFGAMFMTGADEKPFPQPPQAEVAHPETQLEIAGVP